MQRIYAMIGGVLGLPCMVESVQAQIPESPGPPPGEPSVVTVLIAFALLAVVCVAALKSANRSHQD